MDHTKTNINADVETINRIPVIATILDVVCRTTGMGFAAIARVTEDRWIACAVQDKIQFGLEPGGELKVETTICHEIRQSQKLVVIDNVSEDETYACHPTPLLYGFQSYISVPIILKNGNLFGTLCAIDPKPNHLNTPETIGMFQLFADLIAFHLHALEQLATSAESLLQERKTSELREQFIAILGHDLRNPVSAVSSSSQILQNMALPETATRFVKVIKDSAYRMSGLIENMLDFARGRLGEGITLKRADDEPLEIILTQVLTELHIVWPDRIIEREFHLTSPVNCDGRRVAQLFSNLLSNALNYGKKNAPVLVQATSTKSEFTLSVANSGSPIPPAIMGRLFQPFTRGEAEPHKQGLGLGIYIAFEIARAHGGNLDVSSSDEETRFTFHLPL